MSSPSVRAEDLDVEAAETENYNQIEQQRSKTGNNARGGNKESSSSNRDEDHGAERTAISSPLKGPPKSKFKGLAKKVIQKKQEENPSRSTAPWGGKGGNSAVSAIQAIMAQQRRHRKSPSSAVAMLNYMKESGPTKSDDSDDEDDDRMQRSSRPGAAISEQALHGTQGNDSNMLFMAADITPTEGDDTSTVMSDVTSGSGGGKSGDDETAPLKGTGGGGYGSLAAGVRKSRLSRKKQSKMMRHFHRFCRDYLCNPQFWMQMLYENVVHSWMTYIAIPCFVASFILFYVAGNPTFDFLPGGRLSWWLGFVGRQVLMFELGRLSQWLLLDCFVLGTRLSVKLLGPLVTLTAIQAKGWPFLIAAWGVWDMMLLHGDNDFQLHWLYWTGLEIFNTETGLEIISSDTYLRVLVAMAVAGLCTTTKRAAVAVYFGRRQLAEFKPRLEKLLGDIVLLSEVAALGEEAELVAAEQESATLETGAEASEANGSTRGSISAANKKEREVDLKPSNKGGLSSMVYSNVQFSDAVGTEGMQSPPTSYHHRSLTADDNSVFSAGREAPELPPPSIMNNTEVNADRTESLLSRSSSGQINIKKVLDRWDEPIIKNDKHHAQSGTIEEVLRFRRALACMDEDYPFGEAFGPAGNRDACIESANSLYQHLLKLDPTSDHIEFEMLALAIADDDLQSEEHEMKKHAFRRLFRPDAKGELPLLAFVQSCDHVYRRLRYFIASVRNSSVIDKAMEDTFNGLFFFVLFLLLMSVMRLNPWPMLVSVTSLLVSISFALGPSVSKYVEGVLLIAARRPYDLGDRIIITDSNSTNNPGVGESWFVEDINLWATTLRYAKTNEVSTINNSAIASSRIVNCNRSPNAIVSFVFLTNVSVLDGNKMNEFRHALEKYVKQNPRTWEAVAFIRHDAYDVDCEKIFINIAFRHRSGWQDAGRILQNRGQLHRYVFETGKRMGINFQTPPAPQIHYQGGPWTDATGGPP